MENSNQNLQPHLEISLQKSHFGDVTNNTLVYPKGLLSTTERETIFYLASFPRNDDVRPQFYSQNLGFKEKP